MNRADWKNRIIKSLANMADEDFQMRAWTGKGPEVSSLVEVICSLFDDSLILQYLEQYEGDLDKSVIEDIKLLNRKIEKLDTDRLDNQPIETVINEPEWIEIREIAKRLKISLR